MADLSTIVSTRRAPDSNRSRCATLLVCCSLLLPRSVVAGTDIDSLLDAGEAPGGVVFEIVEADATALDEMLPRVRAAIERIRARFPATEFAVVSHGSEQFALQSIYRQEHAQVHQQVQSLVAGEVPVHVCATHAGWYGVGSEDFPDYVDVAPTGPGQVRLYLELGYKLIIVD